MRLLLLSALLVALCSAQTLNIPSPNGNEYTFSTTNDDWYDTLNVQIDDLAFGSATADDVLVVMIRANKTINWCWNPQDAPSALIGVEGEVFTDDDYFRAGAGRTVPPAFGQEGDQGSAFVRHVFMWDRCGSGTASMSLNVRLESQACEFGQNGFLTLSAYWASTSGTPTATGTGSVAIPAGSAGTGSRIVTVTPPTVTGATTVEYSWAPSNPDVFIHAKDPAANCNDGGDDEGAFAGPIRTCAADGAAADVTLVAVSSPTGAGGNVDVTISTIVNTPLATFDLSGSNSSIPLAANTGGLIAVTVDANDLPADGYYIQMEATDLSGNDFVMDLSAFFDTWSKFPTCDGAGSAIRPPGLFCTGSGACQLRHLGFGRLRSSLTPQLPSGSRTLYGYVHNPTASAYSVRLSVSVLPLSTPPMALTNANDRVGFVHSPAVVLDQYKDTLNLFLRSSILPPVSLTSSINGLYVEMTNFGNAGNYGGPTVYPQVSVTDSIPEALAFNEGCLDAPTAVDGLLAGACGAVDLFELAIGTKRAGSVAPVIVPACGPAPTMYVNAAVDADDSSLADVTSYYRMEALPAATASFSGEQFAASAPGAPVHRLATSNSSAGTFGFYHEFPITAQDNVPVSNAPIVVDTFTTDNTEFSLGSMSPVTLDGLNLLRTDSSFASFELSSNDNFNLNTRDGVVSYSFDVYLEGCYWQDNVAVISPSGGGANIELCRAGGSIGNAQNNFPVNGNFTACGTGGVETNITGNACGETRFSVSVAGDPGYFYVGLEHNQIFGGFPEGNILVGPNFEMAIAVNNPRVGVVYADAAGGADQCLLDARSSLGTAPWAPTQRNFFIFEYGMPGWGVCPPEMGANYHFAQVSIGDFDSPNDPIQSNMVAGLDAPPMQQRGFADTDSLSTGGSLSFPGNGTSRFVHVTVPAGSISGTSVVLLEMNWPGTYDEETHNDYEVTVRSYGTRAPTTADGDVPPVCPGPSPFYNFFDDFTNDNAIRGLPAAFINGLRPFPDNSASLYLGERTSMILPHCPGSDLSVWLEVRLAYGFGGPGGGDDFDGGDFDGPPPDFDDGFDASGTGPPRGGPDGGDFDGGFDGGPGFGGNLPSGIGNDITMKVHVVDLDAAPVLSRDTPVVDLGSHESQLVAVRIEPGFNESCPENFRIQFSANGPDGSLDSVPAWTAAAMIYQKSTDFPGYSAPWSFCNADSQDSLFRSTVLDVNPVQNPSTYQEVNVHGVRTNLLLAQDSPTTGFPSRQLPNNLVGWYGIMFVTPEGGPFGDDDIIMKGPIANITSVTARFLDAGLAVTVPTSDPAVASACRELYGPNARVVLSEFGEAFADFFIADTFGEEIPGADPADSSTWSPDAWVTAGYLCSAILPASDSNGMPLTERCASQCANFNTVFSDPALTPIDDGGPGATLIPMMVNCTGAPGDNEPSCYPGLFSANAGCSGFNYTGVPGTPCPGAGDCNNHGLCTFFGSCDCDLGFSGDECQLCDLPCRNNGTCDATGPGAGVCVCPAGWTGELCNEPVCPGGCGAGQACFSPGQCVCEDSYTNGGGSCTPCCSGVGYCEFETDFGESPECHCPPGWSGPQCEVNCGETYCAGNGQCYGGAGSQCFCDFGFGPPGDCSDCVADCGVNGNCTGSGTVPGGPCECADGWTGFFCDQPICSSGCGVNGYCSAPDTCECHWGFYGDSCEHNCGEDLCNGQGWCEAAPGELTPATLNSTGSVECYCYYGWGGDDCSDCGLYNYCGNGNLTCTDGTPVCECDAGWTGPWCWTPVCTPGLCSGPGEICVAPNTCGCDWGWRPNPDYPTNGTLCIPQPPGWAAGDPHYRTFDGKAYTFNGKGEFVALETRAGAPDDVEVQVRQEPCSAGSSATCVTAIAVSDGATAETVSVFAPLGSADGRALEVRVDDLVIYDSETPNGRNSSTLGTAGTFSLQGARVLLDLIETPTGRTVRVIVNNGAVVASLRNEAGFGSLALSADVATMSGFTTGLYGTLNDNDGDDFEKRDLSQAANATEFGEDWRVADAGSSLFSRVGSDPSFNDVNDQAGFTAATGLAEGFNLSSIDAGLLAAAISTCEDTLGLTGDFADACIYDVAVTEEISFAVASASGASLQSSAGSSNVTEASNPSSGPSLLSCPNACSARGVCDTETGTCNCFAGFGGTPDCSSGYVAPTCGDGVAEGAEACDNGAANANEPDSCRIGCALPACGDGIVDSNEECDGTDDCDELCQLVVVNDDDDGDDDDEEDDDEETDEGTTGAFDPTTLAAAGLVAVVVLLAACTVMGRTAPKDHTIRVNNSSAAASASTDAAAASSTTPEKKA